MFEHKKFLQSCSLEPGVYEMLDSNENIIYVGKAKNLKNRLSSYFNKNVSKKTEALVSKIATIRTTITGTEKEALILEANLIKKYKPKYNILLRDDKSYPYIILDNRKYPRLDFYRGVKTSNKAKDYEFFGPYPSASYARQTLNLLQKVFLLRNCSESFFKNRSRPCMQYQIKRCSAPCVGYIDINSYKSKVDNAKLFLMGKSLAVIKNLVAQMNKASDNLEYENAAKIRDNIKTLQDVQQQQYISSGSIKNIDLIVILNLANKYCISLNKIRNGVFISTQQFYLSVSLDDDDAKDSEFAVALYNFLAQYYLSRNQEQDFPDEILLNEKLKDKNLFIDILSSKNKKIKITDEISKNKGYLRKYKEWIDIAIKNLHHVVYSKTNLLDKTFDFKNSFNTLKELFKLDKLTLIECFDVSHTSGHYTVASQVSCDQKGLNKNLYKKYNIKLSKHSDDYGAMREVITRRFKKRTNLPEILLIDGGIGQLSVVYDELCKLNLDRQIILLGICKGDLRKSANDRILYLNNDQGDKIVDLELEENARRMLQIIRDDAHRFAIKSMQTKRAKASISSILEEIPGLGKKRIQAILEHFGGWAEVKKATKEQLVQIPGISDKLSSIILNKIKQLI